MKDYLVIFHTLQVFAVYTRFRATDPSFIPVLNTSWWKVAFAVTERHIHKQTKKRRSRGTNRYFCFCFCFCFFSFSTFCLFISVDWTENAPATSFCWKRKISFSCEFFLGSVLSKQNKGNDKKCLYVNLWKTYWNNYSVASLSGKRSPTLSNSFHDFFNGNF